MAHRLALYERLSDDRGPRVWEWGQYVRLAASPPTRHSGRQQSLFVKQPALVWEHPLERRRQGTNRDVSFALHPRLRSRSADAPVNH